MRVTTSIKLEKEYRDFAKNFFKQFGLSLSDGINMFLAKIAMDKRLPFELELPSDETIKAIEEAENENLIVFDNVDELIKEARS